MLLQFSAAHGPEECCLAVKHALRVFLQDAAQSAVTVTIAEEMPSQHGLHSVLLSLDGEYADALADRWCGTLQWQCASPFRPKHRRKNWFIGIRRFTAPQAVSDSEIIFERLKSQGPGGQHVNKTESAVRATHIATGITVKVQSERSQHANKKLACRLIEWHLSQYQQQQSASLNGERHRSHHQIERGRATRSFSGPDFRPVS